ncbi:hypothetical protein A2U01_0056847, partial [Trifolium medium]|nr:hypothetical protein [Trifolium medium]
AALGASGSTPSGTPSVRVSPAPSVEIIEKRGRDGDLEDVSSRKNLRLDVVSGSASGPHRLIPGHPFEHSPLFDGHTKVVVSDAGKTILEDMGPVAIRDEGAKSSEAVFRLLEVVTFLNGREYQYLKERDVAQKKI